VRSAVVERGRRIVLVLEPGDEVLAALAAACEEHGVTTAVVPVFLGAFTSVSLIGTSEPVDDPDVPLPLSTEIFWVEGSGSATIAPGADGRAVVHLHGTFGDKLDGATGYSGHLLRAVTHYTAEVVIDEVTGADLRRLPDDRAHGITTLRVA
jgi:predicted DNA-binding protein with PD1-like motif